MNALIVLETNTIGTGENAFSASDEHFSVGGERVENVRSNFTCTHTRTAASFQQNLFRFDCYSQVLTSENERSLSRSHTRLRVHYTHKLYTQ